MFRSFLFGAAMFSLFSSAFSCQCTLPFPRLSECNVGDDSVALLVTFKCVKSAACDLNQGAAVADVTIDKVFKDNTDLGLSVGDMVTVRSLLQSATCGVGAAFRPGDQWILFARPPFQPTPEPIDDLTLGSRRLQQSRAAPSRAVDENGQALLVSDLVFKTSGIDDEFSDGTTCEVEEADLSTHDCLGSVINPTPQQIMQLMNGCNSLTPPDPVFTSET